MTIVRFALFICLLTSSVLTACSTTQDSSQTTQARTRTLLDTGWTFYKYPDAEATDTLIYDVRPKVTESQDGKPADAEPTAAIKVTKGANQQPLKPWVLPTANSFLPSKNQHHARPNGNPGANFPYVQLDFDDSQWQSVEVPHDWAAAGPFYSGNNPKVGGGMGRLPSPGVAWYRKTLHIDEAARGQTLFLEVDGAMSYAMVWLNGVLVGGWPYGYASWQVDLTPYVRFGQANQLAIRVDNPPESSRWYPGGGIYRNVWLTQKHAIHLAQWGTNITTPSVTPQKADVHIAVTLNNTLPINAEITATTNIYTLNKQEQPGVKVATASAHKTNIQAMGSSTITLATQINAPKLWGPKPHQTPHRYVAVTSVYKNKQLIDQVKTPFGVRTLTFDENKGILINGELIPIQGVNQHHDLGPIGAAFNEAAAIRQLNTLRDMGVNAIRMAHNPPAPELLNLTDRLGFIVVNELFDVWERKKTPLDHHLIFPDWHEADARAWVRRDRNHPSVIMWSVGNEVGEQYTGEDGANVARRLHSIVKEEDPTRPTTNSMNFAKPPMPLPGVFDVISLNYQGEGIRDAEAYKGMKGITTTPAYPNFKKAHPQKVIVSSENAAAVSSRGTYLFPVTQYKSAPVKEGHGGDRKNQHVSAYELYTTPFGASVDKVFTSLENHPYVAGGFAWSGWDYLGEPTPYYTARSSYFGSIDLAGFKKDRFYLYQSHWRPELPMVHILPHWNWPDRDGKITPIHIFTSGDEVELFLNNQSLGKKHKKKGQFRLRWDNVKYQAGTVRAVAYKNGKFWAENSIKTTGPAFAIKLEADKTHIKANSKDLAFITAKIVDKNGLVVPTAQHQLVFNITGPGSLVAADNGDPSDLTAFINPVHNAFNGKCLAIVKANRGAKGPLKITVKSSVGLMADALTLHPQ